MRNVYKCRANDFEDGKASVIGDYVAAKLDMLENETCVGMVLTSDYKGFVLYFYENGKVAKVPLSQFETKLNRKKLTNAYNDKSDATAIISVVEEKEFAVFSSGGRILRVNSAVVLTKIINDTLVVNYMTRKK